MLMQVRSFIFKNTNNISETVLTFSAFEYIANRMTKRSAY